MKYLIHYATDEFPDYEDSCIVDTHEALLQIQRNSQIQITDMKKIEIEYYIFIFEQIVYYGSKSPVWSAKMELVTELEYDQTLERLQEAEDIMNVKAIRAAKVRIGNESFYVPCEDMIVLRQFILMPNAQVYFYVDDEIENDNRGICR